jgi:hypothetical protein
MPLLPLACRTFLPWASKGCLEGAACFPECGGLTPLRFAALASEGLRLVRVNYMH